MLDETTVQDAWVRPTHGRVFLCEEEVEEPVEQVVEQMLDGPVEDQQPEVRRKQSRTRRARPAGSVLTLREAADDLGVSVRTLQRLRASGEIAFVTLGTGQRRPRVGFMPQHLADYLLRAEHVASALPAARRA